MYELDTGNCAEGLAVEMKSLGRSNDISKYSLWRRKREKEVLSPCEELSIGFVPLRKLVQGSSFHCRYDW
jgi:hypothetical protein